MRIHTQNTSVDIQSKLFYLKAKLAHFSLGRMFRNLLLCFDAQAPLTGMQTKENSAQFRESGSYIQENKNRNLYQ